MNNFMKLARITAFSLTLLLTVLIGLAVMEQNWSLQYIHCLWDNCQFRPHWGIPDMAGLRIEGILILVFVASILSCIAWWHRAFRGGARSVLGRFLLVAPLIYLILFCFYYINVASVIY